MTDLDRQILELDLKHLTDKQTQWLHDLKAQAFKERLMRDFQAMKGLAVSACLIVALVASAQALPIIVDDAHVPLGTDPAFGWVVGNFVAKELALSNQFDEVVRAREVTIEKGSEFDVPGLRFSEYLYDIKSPLVLTLEVVEGGRTVRHLRINAHLQQVVKQRGPNESDSMGGYAANVAHQWTQSQAFELHDQAPITLAKQIARQVSQWTVANQSFISGNLASPHD